MNTRGGQKSICGESGVALLTFPVRVQSFIRFRQMAVDIDVAKEGAEVPWKINNLIIIILRDH